MAITNNTYNLKNKKKLPETPNGDIINNKISITSYGDYKYELKQNAVPSGASKVGTAYFFKHSNGGNKEPLNVVIQIFDNTADKIINSVEVNRINFKNGLFDFTQPQDKEYSYFCFFKTSINDPVTYDIYFSTIQDATWETLQCDKLKVAWLDVPAEVKADATVDSTNLGSITNLVIDGQFNSTKLNLFDTSNLDDLNNEYSWREHQIRNLKTYLTPNVVYTCEYTGLVQANKILQDQITSVMFNTYDDEYKKIASSPQKYLNIYSPVGLSEYQLENKYIAINLNGLYALRPKKTITLSFYIRLMSVPTADKLVMSFEFAELGRMNDNARWDFIDGGNFSEGTTIDIQSYTTWSKVSVTLTRPDSPTENRRSRQTLDYDQTITQIRMKLPLNLVEYSFGITNLMLSYGENDVDFIRSENDLIRSILGSPELLYLTNYGVISKSSTLGDISINALYNGDRETSILCDGRLIKDKDVYEYYNFDKNNNIDEDQPINYIKYKPLRDFLLNTYGFATGNDENFATAYSLYNPNRYPDYITDADITEMDFSLMIAKNKTEFSKSWFQVSDASKGITLIELSRGCDLPANQGLDVKTYGIVGKMDTFIYQANMDNYYKYMSSLPNFDPSFFNPNSEDSYSIKVNPVETAMFYISSASSDTKECFSTISSFVMINSAYLTDFRFDDISSKYGKINTLKIKSIDCKILSYNNNTVSQTQQSNTYNLIAINDTSIAKHSGFNKDSNTLIPNQISIIAKQNSQLPDNQKFDLVLNTKSSVIPNQVLDNIQSSFTWNYTQDKYNPISDNNAPAKKVLMPFAVSQVALFGVKFTGGIAPENYKGAWFAFSTSRKKTIQIKQINNNLIKLQPKVLNNVGNFAIWLDTTGSDNAPTDLPINYIPLRVNIFGITKKGDIENLISDAINSYEIKILDYSGCVLIDKNNDLEIKTADLFGNNGYKSDKNISYNNSTYQYSTYSTAGSIVPIIQQKTLSFQNSNFYNTANVNYFISLI